MVSLAIIAFSIIIVILTGYMPLLLLPAGICIGLIEHELADSSSKPVQNRVVQKRKQTLRRR
ncbi:hypothetical protein [Lactobacillus taiwanensis]|uniref:hypothetical protein n=1 Tax=Lactobacillus taiwanensis TaxID=508451 RepID=UPI001AEC6EDB|nr:hypothetical protein [Lactobacillus taiwanensis]QTQ40801.1 hypothetical protein H1A07_09630 [Lactobacillus taiwanensis]